MAERKTDAPIGVFDSGLGGLTVTKELVKTLPGENLVYFGDTARVPYGSKSKETILHYTKQILNFMKTQEVKAIVVACNTVSAYALEEVRNRVKVPMIGVVRPGAETAAFVTKNRKIGVIGTKATVESRLYETCIREMIPEAEVYGAPCPLFVPLVEEGLWKDPVTEEIAKRYLTPLKQEGVDTLILGCTHYPLLQPLLQKIMGRKVKLINPAEETAKRTRVILDERRLLNESGDAPKYRFYVSDDPKSFQHFASDVLSFPIPMPEKVDIEQYS